MTNQLTIAQIFGALNRHRIKSLIAWSLVVFCVGLLYLVWPRQYVSEGHLYIKIDRSNTPVVPTTTGTSVSVQDTRETEIRSVMEIIRSRAVLDQVVRDVGAKEILRNGVLDYVPRLSLLKPTRSSSKSGISSEEYKRIKETEAASKLLGERLELFNEKKSSVVVVTVRANDPLLAQRILTSVFRYTREIHTSIHDVSSSTVYFDDQFAEQESRLRSAVQELADFRNDLGVLSVEAELGSLQSIVASIDKDLVDADVACSESMERKKRLAKLFKETPAMLATPTQGVERLSFEESNTELWRLKQERERLRSTVTDRDVRLRNVIRQIAALEGELGKMLDDRTELESRPNPVYQTIETDLKRTEVKLYGDQARLAALRREKAKVTERMKKLNLAEVEADAKRRKVEVAQQYLAIYTQPRGESKAIGALDERSISDVRVYQKPTLTVDHVNPKAIIVLPLGLICGLLAAVATSLFFDRNNLGTSLSEGDVEQALQLPVLISLPRVYAVVMWTVTAVGAMRTDSLGMKGA